MSQPTNLMPFQTNVTVGTTPIMGALPANPARKGLIISNNGTGQVNLTFGGGTALGTSLGTVIIPPPPPTTTTGLALQAGTSFELLPAMAPNVAMGAQINAIAGAAGEQLSFLEF